MDGKDVNEPQGEDHEVQRHQSPAEMVGLIEHSGFREQDHKHTYVTNPQSKMESVLPFKTITSSYML